MAAHLNRLVPRVFILCLLVLSLAPVASCDAPAEVQAPLDLTGAEFENLLILHMGGGNLATSLVDVLQDAGGHVLRSSDVPDTVELGPDVIILFSGGWFEQRVDDAELHDLLKLGSTLGASMAMVDGATSKFFETLERAGVYEFPETEAGTDRNPAYANPPMAGLKMKTVDEYATARFLYSNTRDPVSLAASLIEWHTYAE